MRKEHPGAVIILVTAFIIPMLASCGLGYTLASESVVTEAAPLRSRNSAFMAGSRHESIVWQMRYSDLLDAVTRTGCEVSSDASGTVTVTLPAHKPAAAPNTRSGASTLKPPQSAAQGSWRSAGASWYSPGFYGHGLKDGSTLTASSMGFAHKTLAIGTRVTFRYKGRTVTAKCSDRGPYVAGRSFDLQPGLKAALGFGSVGTVEWRVLR